MSKEKLIIVQDTEIRFLDDKQTDYFSLTDIARRFNPDAPADVISNWFRNKDTVEFLGTWEVLHNPDFKLLEFEEFKRQAGFNRFTLSPSKWAAETGAKGVITKSGRFGGGTFAHKDIAMAFCYWLSPTFQLYVIREFQRLKEDESHLLKSDWNLKRQLTKANWHIHTEAVRGHLVPMMDWHTQRESIAQASEADLLNLALFGMTAKQWQLANPDLKGNLRDHASTEQLLVMANLQSLNAKLMEWGSPKDQRLEILHKTAREQMEILVNTKAIGEIKKLQG